MTNELNKDDEIKRAMLYMNCFENNKNIIGIEHFKMIMSVIIDSQGQQSDIVKMKLRGTLCISQQYIKEYFQSLFAWEIIKTENNRLYWLGAPKLEGDNP